MADFLQSVNSPCEVPIYDNFVKIEELNEHEKFYIESHTSNARIVYKDDNTYCYNGGYYSDQLWYLEPSGVSYYTIHNANSSDRKMFFNGSNVGCFAGQQYDDQLWRFQYTGNGYYRIINRANNGKLYLQSSGNFGGFIGSDYDDQLWRIVPESFPTVLFHNINMGARLVGNEKPTIYRGSQYRDQIWRLIPVEMMEEQCPRLFYIQNVETGRKLAHQKGGDFLAYEGNNYSDQHWEIRALGGHFYFINQVTSGKLYAHSDLSVGCYVGPDYEDQEWMLLGPVLKRLTIKSIATGATLSIGGINEWTIIPDLNGGYYLQNYVPKSGGNGGRLYYKPYEFNTYDGQVYSDQIWYVTTPDGKTWSILEITNKKYSGKMVSKDSASVTVELDPVTDQKSLQFKILLSGENTKYNDYLLDEVSDRNVFWLSDSTEDFQRLLAVYPGSLEDLALDTQDSTRGLQEDEEYYGFQGLTDETDYVYRVCRADEDISQGIRCVDPTSTRTVAQHVASGTRIPSRYISTTCELSTALLWAFYVMDTQSRYLRPQPLRVVRIHLSRAQGTELEAGCVNLNCERVREHFIQGAIHRNYARSSREVLFQDHIPPSMFDVIENPTPPPKPQARKRKRPELKLQQLLENLKI